MTGVPDGQRTALGAGSTRADKEAGIGGDLPAIRIIASGSSQACQPVSASDAVVSMLMLRPACSAARHVVGDDLAERSGMRRGDRSRPVAA